MGHICSLLWADNISLSLCDNTWIISGYGCLSPGVSSASSRSPLVPLASPAASPATSKPTAPPGLLSGDIGVNSSHGGLLVPAQLSVIGVVIIGGGGGLVIGGGRGDRGGILRGRGSVLSLVRGSGQSVPLSGDLIIEAVEVLGGGAVKVEPPVADEVVLVEEGSVGAEEAVLGETTSTIGCADVESLALSLGVRVVTFNKLDIASVLSQILSLLVRCLRVWSTDKSQQVAAILRMFDRFLVFVN